MTAAMQEEVKIMGKYESFHFSPENNRSILMPRASRGTEYHPPKRNRHRELFPPIPEDKLNHSSPYYQCNLGITEKMIVINGQERKYAIYVPDGMISKGAGIFVFPENGTNAEAFIHSENWIALAEKYHTALVVFESSQWDREQIDKEFDYAWEIITLEFVQRLTVDICESYMYVMGFGAGAEIAAAFALTYSATFAAFAADGNCAVDPELLEILGKLPSDGDLTLKKTDIAIPGFLIDRSGKAKETFEYMKTILRAKEEGLANAYGEVYLEQPERGQYYVNAQPVAQAWLGNSESVSEVSRETLNEEMIKFVLRFSRWGSFGNNCLRPMRTQEEIGVVRVEQIVEGLPRYWDIYVPSGYRSGDGKKYPLVVAIHGMSCNAEYFERTSDWYRLAEERDFFVCFASAYPYNDGLAKFPVPHWALKSMGVPLHDEVPYFEKMLDYMEKTYSIDPSRIYVTGHSNGSHMTQELARRIPERFAAFAPTGAMDGWDPQVRPLEGCAQRPVWFMLGEYDIASVSLDPGTIARATLENYCHSNGVEPRFENWYDNGKYHTLVMYDQNHAPMVCFTVIRSCPHTYTAEMAQLTWDHFMCHFRRNEDGSIRYDG